MLNIGSPGAVVVSMAPAPTSLRRLQCVQLRLEILLTSAHPGAADQLSLAVFPCLIHAQHEREIDMPIQGRSR